jgi:phosphatidate cytidylyltransferase
MAVAGIIAVLGVYGDLIESLLKRSMKIKDSGHFLPGHGGILDRFDSVLFAAPVVFFYLELFVY